MRSGLVAICFLALSAGVALASGYSELNLGLAYRGHNDWDATILHMTAALNAPDLPATYRSVAYIDRGGAYFQKGQIDKAIADFNSCLAADPDYLQALAERGAAYARQDKLDLAIADFTALIVRRPARDVIYVARGGAYGEQKKYDLAIADFSTAIKLSPSKAGIYMARGLARRMVDQDDAAVDDYSKAIDINSDFAGAYIGRSLAYRDEGDYFPALRDIQTAMKLKPSDNEYLDLGITQWEAGRYADAAKSFALASQQGKSVDPYAVLWHIIAATGADGRIGDDLRQAASALDLAKWPGPVIAVYLDRAQPDAALKAARNSDPVTQANQVCEANFYLAQWQVLAGNKAAPILQVAPMLQAAREQCPHEFVERDAAAAELKRLQ
jgi:tetratricopeptide (TPR) repeat protein